MSDLKDEIEALRRELREKHAQDLLQINSLAAEQTAYQRDVARALEDLLATHAKRSPLIEQLVVTVANRLGLARALAPNAAVIEHTTAKPDYQLELEHVLQRQDAINAQGRRPN